MECLYSPSFSSTNLSQSVENEFYLFEFLRKGNKVIMHCLSRNQNTYLGLTGFQLFGSNFELAKSRNTLITCIIKRLQSLVELL